MNVWKCHFPYVEQGKTWLERDWAGMRTVQGTKCVSVTSDGQVKSKDCTAYGKNVEEKIFVHGKKLMGVCATAGMVLPIIIRRYIGGNVLSVCFQEIKLLEEIDSKISHVCCFPFGYVAKPGL